MNIVKNMALIAAIVTIAGFVGVSSAIGAVPAEQSFGIIDMNKVMQTTDVAKDIFSHLESKRKEYQSQISKEEESLRSAEQEILKQKDSLSKADFDKKRHAFEERVVNGQKLVQERKQTLDMAFNSSMVSLRREVAKIVADVAKEKGYSAVFTEDAVMISSADLDITDTVIGRVNKNVKKMAVNWAAPKSGKSK